MDAVDLSVIVGRDVEPHVGMRVRLTPQALSRRRIAAKVYVLMILVFFLSGCSRASSLALCEYATACAQALCAYRCEAHAFAQQLEQDGSAVRLLRLPRVRHQLRLRDVPAL